MSLFYDDSQILIMVVCNSEAFVSVIKVKFVPSKNTKSAISNVAVLFQLLVRKYSDPRILRQPHRGQEAVSCVMLLIW